MDTKNKLLKLNGIIINEKNYNEYDKFLTLLTEKLGKINVYAFGVRKQNSKSIGKVRLFTFATYEIREIGGKYQLENATLIKSFFDKHNDYNDICYASYFIELADYFSFENIENDEVYRLLYYTFKAIEDKKVPIKLIRRIFELKMLKYEGIYKDSESVKEKLKFTWDFIINTDPLKLFSFTLNDELMDMLDMEVACDVRENVTKKFKTLDLLE